MLQVHDPLVIAQPSDQLEYARQIVRAEAAALEQVAQRLDESFLQAIDLLSRGPGRIGLTGTGKSADVAQKIAGTMNSTGSRAYVLDVTRAAHGDLGMIHPDDAILILSHSGESEEIVRLLGPLRSLARALIALTSNRQGTLARQADVAIVLGPLEEVCPLGLADRPIREVMTANPFTVIQGSRVADAVEIMRRQRISELPVIDRAGNPVGLVDITDVMGLMPAEDAEVLSQVA
jgi:D-arabinose 5-phosphate isomerase GutQ